MNITHDRLILIYGCEQQWNSMMGDVLFLCNVFMDDILHTHDTDNVWQWLHVHVPLKLGVGDPDRYLKTKL